jgi:hypothetical protein
MIKFWSLPLHLNENNLPSPFQNLLKEEYLDYNTEVEETDPYKSALKWVREALKILKVAESEAKAKLAEGDPDAINEIETITQLEDIACGIKQLIQEIQEKGVNTTGEQAVLSSSWLAAGIASFYDATLSTSEYQSQLSDLITLVSKYLANPLLSWTCLAATLCLRQALLSLPENPRSTSTSETGTLSLLILKRYKPTRVYGPYEYPNVRSETWKVMTKARGAYGTGAGTLFWRQYLDTFYARKSPNRKRSKA